MVISLRNSLKNRDLKYFQQLDQLDLELVREREKRLPAGALFKQASKIVLC